MSALCRWSAPYSATVFVRLLYGFALAQENVFCAIALTPTPLPIRFVGEGLFDYPSRLIMAKGDYMVAGWGF